MHWRASPPARLPSVCHTYELPSFLCALPPQASCPATRSAGSARTGRAPSRCCAAWRSAAAWTPRRTRAWSRAPLGRALRATATRRSRWVWAGRGGTGRVPRACGREGTCHPGLAAASTVPACGTPLGFTHNSARACAAGLPAQPRARRGAAGHGRGGRAGRLRGAPRAAGSGICGCAWGSSRGCARRGSEDAHGGTLLDRPSPRVHPLCSGAGHPKLMRVVAAATRTTQNTDDAEAWACAGAAVLEAVVARGDSIQAAAEAAAAELRAGSGERQGAQWLVGGLAGAWSCKVPAARAAGSGQCAVFPGVLPHAPASAASSAR